MNEEWSEVNKKKYQFTRRHNLCNQHDVEYEDMADHHTRDVILAMINHFLIPFSRQIKYQYDLSYIHFYDVQSYINLLLLNAGKSLT